MQRHWTPEEKEWQEIQYGKEYTVEADGCVLYEGKRRYLANCVFTRPGAKVRLITTFDKQIYGRVGAGTILFGSTDRERNPPEPDEAKADFARAFERRVTRRPGDRPGKLASLMKRTAP
uniref:Uncharacterized protein n=1 Tax=Candidatus Kentrum sp. UNK TaxID=2126344 RepID=A0A450ZYW0_9GAMM|nr:MAG: hypothetical protein BECKUNK1418G_GA0071005_100561 [Candidatus Kentron sp. UNK]VFK68650.1 MAG: hypothetical protein BECKUNK1418H_GA0071006_100461 [Candidatus Kentron sp. UNK]